MADMVSDRLYLGRITPGMDVCDVTGEKVGSIAHIYHAAGSGEIADEGASVRTVDDVIEVKTGFLGLGKHFYIPLSTIQEVLTDSVFLSRSRESFEELSFEKKPEHLTDVR